MSNSIAPFAAEADLFCWLSYRVVVTLCHCIASDNEQLSFEKGMLLQVLDAVDGSDWLMCRYDNRRGLVHRACVKSVDP